MSAETSNNVVTVSHPARVCSIALPRVLIAVLVVRVGEPLGSARGGWLTKLIFDVEEGYEGFRDKYHGLFAEDDRAIYLKTTKHGGQSKYVRHSNDHIRGALQHRWRLATLSDKRSSFHFDAFLYVQNATQPPSQFQRATAGRIERARAQRMAYESTSAVSFEPITAHHPASSTLGDQIRPLRVPDGNTTAQAIELDKQRNKSCSESVNWVSVEVDRSSLWNAAGLPNHNVFAAGIFRAFSPPSASNP
ncbi:hypothetical protein GQ600_6236 [Phytophthora cactorum]|nr:hypothetical protein GQ600_6236 [Phytophthora cactorum]